MILTPTWWQEWTWSDKKDKILETTKKEEIENLSNKRNNKKAVMLDHFDEEEIIFRKDVESFLEQSINKDFFNLGKVKNYHIFTEGVSSIVARMDMEDGKKYVFKSGNSFIEWWNERVHIEGKVYNLWRGIDIKTPTVYKEWTIIEENRKIPYIVMEYIQPEKEFSKDTMETSMLQEIGENTAKMNSIHGKWFGRVKKMEWDMLIGMYDTTNELYESYDKKIRTLEKRGEIKEYEIKKTQEAIKILKKDFASWTQASITHDDVRENFFLTKPMTIFDPNPRLDHPLNDIASISADILLDNDIIKEEREIAIQHIYHGYEKQNGKKIDQNILHACILLKIIQKIRWMSGSQKKEKKIQEALDLFKKIEII